MTQLKQLESAHKQFANQRMSPWSLFLMAWLILSSIPLFFFFEQLKKFVWNC